MSLSCYCMRCLRDPTFSRLVEHGLVTDRQTDRQTNAGPQHTPQ